MRLVITGVAGFIGSDVLRDAMAARLAVISTRVSGIPELVEDGVNGDVLAARMADLLGGAR